MKENKVLGFQVRRAIKAEDERDAALAQIAALREQALKPDMFWNDADPEKPYSSVDEFLNAEICSGMPLEVGDTRTIQCAIRLANFDIRVTSIDEEESEAEFEIIAAINAKEQLA